MQKPKLDLSMTPEMEEFADEVRVALPRSTLTAHTVERDGSSPLNKLFIGQVKGQLDTLKSEKIAMKVRGLGSLLG